MLGRRKRLAGLDIGGGTPSAVDAAHVGALMDSVRARFELPDAVTVSIETTPKIAAGCARIRMCFPPSRGTGAARPRG